MTGVAAALAIAGCTARRFDNTAPRSGEVTAAGATTVRISAGAGWLRIEGRRGLKQVRATGIAHASSEALLRQIRLTVTRTGSIIDVIATVPADTQSIGQPAALDLTVEVPQTVALDVRDASGETIVHDVGPLTITDSLGGLEIEGVRGDVSIRDGAGDLQLTDVIGNVRIVDGAGAMYISNIRGSVDIPIDGAGEIQVAGVTGNLMIGSKESGEVAVRDVGGNFVVDAKGSGSIEYHGVRGRVSVAGRSR